MIKVDDLYLITTENLKISPKKRIVKRDYEKWLNSHLDNNFIKVLTGIRRSGKSFLLKLFANGFLFDKKTIKRNILFLNFEDPRLTTLNTPRELLEIFKDFYIKADLKYPVFLFLDEIQNVPQWEKFVRYVYDNYNDNVQIFLTGSNSTLLASEFSSVLSGRLVAKTIYPFNFIEYLELLNISYKNEDFYRNFDLLRTEFVNYLQYGGLPEIADQEKEIRREYILSLVKKIITDDIVKRFKVSKVVEMEQILKYIVTNSTSIISLRNIVNWMNHEGYNITVDTVSRFIDYFQKAYLIQKLRKYSLKSHHIFNTDFKYFSLDNSFLSFLSFKLDFKNSILLESWVLSVLRSYKDLDIFYGRYLDYESDFIIRNNNKFTAIQVTWQINNMNLKRELRIFKYIPDGWDKILITFEDFDVKIIPKNVKVIKALDLAFKRDSLI